MTTFEVAKSSSKLFLLPIGSTEQHGPYLPLGTDTFVTDYLSEQIAKQIPNLIQLPTLNYSCANEHLGFAGTLTLNPQTLMQILTDLCRSVADYSDKIFLLSFHGGNKLVLQLFEAEWNYTHKKSKVYLVDFTSNQTDLIEAKLLKGKVDKHAGNGEISIGKYLFPKNVKFEKTNEKDKKKIILSKVFNRGKIIDYSSIGIIDSNPMWIVSPKVGKKILYSYIDQGVKFIKNEISIQKKGESS